MATKTAEAMTKSKPSEQPALFAGDGSPEVQPMAENAPRKLTRKNAVVVNGNGAVPSAPISESEQMIAMFERAIRDPAVDVSKAREIMAMRKELNAERAQHAFNDAMASAQAEIGMVAVDKTNKQTSSKYASYPALDRAVRPIYSKYGFALSFDTEECPIADCIRVVCYVSCAGHVRKPHINMPADGKGAKGGDVMTKTHAAGSAVQYGMRYLLKMIFNIATGEDDDGNRASEKRRDEDNTPISEMQIGEISKAVEFCGVGLKTFCSHYKIDTVKDLPMSLFSDALQACKNYHDKKKGGETNG